MRLLEGFEVFRLIGWCDAWWPRDLLWTKDGLAWYDMLSSLAGEWLSVWQWAPLQMAIAATVGKFCDRVGESHASEDVPDKSKSPCNNVFDVMDSQEPPPTQSDASLEDFD